jgi:uncharacterized membrane protein YfcA
MGMLAFSAVVWLGSFCAGVIGALTGLGGGVVIVQLLVLALGVNLKYAIGASLVSVIATSSGAAVAYLREGYTNLRVGMVLEVATTVGSLAGAAIALYVSGAAIEVVFGAVLLMSAYFARKDPKTPDGGVRPDRVSRWLRMDSSCPTAEGMRAYRVSHVPAGFGLMFVAGALSGLLGIGSGALKVLAMDRVMRLPLKVSTTTSNFMIGVTAAAGAGVYLSRGYIDPAVAMPVVLGVLPGALVGARLLPKMKSSALRWVFITVIVLLGIEMIAQGSRGAT